MKTLPAGVRTRLASALLALAPLAQPAIVASAVGTAEPVADVVTPVSFARESRQTARRAPSSTLDTAASHRVAWKAASAIPGATVATVRPTGSMRPIFDENALLVLEPAPFDQLRVGDIVTYRHPRLDTPVVHRLLEKRGDAFWARGDHNSQMDDVYVTRENYLKRVCGIIYGGVPDAPALAAKPALGG